MLDTATRETLQQRHYPDLERQVFGPLYDALGDPSFHGATVLDAGCGKGSWILQRFKPNYGLLVGIDVYPAQNELADAFGMGSLEHLPFADATFDLILCYVVLEHVAQPERAVMEFARVLKPGGTLIVKTPAAYAPTSLLTRLLPYRAHCWLKGLIGVGKEDIFPTYFRANTAPALRRLMRQAGLTTAMVRKIDQTYAYASFNSWTYTLGLWYSRFIQKPGWGWLRNGIVALGRKEPAHES